jgi:hypothetical protein
MHEINSIYRPIIILGKYEKSVHIVCNVGYMYVQGDN